MAKRDIQVNPFTNEIMTGGLKSCSESLTIPASANFPAETPSLFILFLTEVPYLDNQSLYPFSISGYTKVNTTPTSAGQYRVAPFGSARPNAVQFHHDDAGNSVTIDYYGWGGLIEISEDFVDTSTNQSIGGVKTFTNTTDSTSKDTGAVILEGGLGVEKKAYIGTDLNVGGNYTSVFKGSDTTASTSKDTGAMILEGGLGVKKDISSGGLVRAVNGFEAVKSGGNVGLKQYIKEIGDWNMDSTASVNVVITPGFKKIRNIYVTIRDNLDLNYSSLANGGTISSSYSSPYNLVTLTRTASGVYDSASYNSTSYNRGWVYIDYEV